MQKIKTITEEAETGGGKTVDTLFLSDPHLLLPGSREEEIKKLIVQAKFKRLILGGDIFQYFRPKRITARQWRFLLFLDTLARERPEAEIVVLTGNHDRNMIKLRHRLNITITDEYIWSCAGKKYLAIHGHQFKRIFFDFSLRYQASCYFYIFVRLLRRRRKRSVRVYIDKLYKQTEPSRRMAARAAIYGRIKNVNSIICGHTHQAFRTIAEGIEFLNSGSSYFMPSTYLTIDNQGASFHEF